MKKRQLKYFCFYRDILRLLFFLFSFQITFSQKFLDNPNVAIIGDAIVFEQNDQSVDSTYIFIKGDVNIIGEEYISINITKKNGISKNNTDKKYVSVKSKRKSPQVFPKKKEPIKFISYSDSTIVKSRLANANSILSNYSFSKKWINIFLAIKNSFDIQKLVKESILQKYDYPLMLIKNKHTLRPPPHIL